MPEPTEADRQAARRLADKVTRYLEPMAFELQAGDCTLDRQILVWRMLAMDCMRRGKEAEAAAKAASS